MYQLGTYVNNACNVCRQQHGALICLYATSILHLHCYPAMNPSDQPLLEENTLQIMEKILDCGILESSPLGSRAERTLRCMVNDVSDDGWNTDEDDDELQRAIYNCGILEASLHYRTEDQSPGERPKKKLVKSKADRESMDNHPLHVRQ